LLCKPPKFNLDHSLTYSEIVVFIKGFDSKAKISRQSISYLNNRKIIFKSVPRTKDTLKFVQYIKAKFKHFDDENFFQ